MIWVFAVFWNDMNEPASFKGPLPDDVQFADEDDTAILHKDAHNIYGHCMAMATKDGWLNMMAADHL